MTKPERVEVDFIGLTKHQTQLLMKNAEIKAKGTFTPPPLDMDGIKRRAAEVEKGPLRNDLYRLICEVEILQRQLVSLT